MPIPRSNPTYLATLARSPAGVVGLYLAVTLPLALLGVEDARDLWRVGLHTGALVAAFRWGVTGREPGWGTAFVPLLALPFLYWEIPWLNQALGSGYHDGLVHLWELRLTGGDPSREWAGALPHLWLSEILHLTYASFYPAVLLPPLLLALEGRWRACSTTVLGVLMAATACYVVFTVFPVQGPRYFGPPQGIPDGPVRRLVLAVLESGSSRGSAFPSAHMAIMTAQTVLALRFQSRAGALLAPLTLGVGLGAVYGGFHYAIDMVVGALSGGAAAWLALSISHSSAAAPPSP